MLKNKKVWALVLVVCLLFIPCVASAEESSFVTYTDGKSYDGLPMFPLNRKNTSGYYEVFNEYVLFSNADNTEFYLFCVSGSDGSMYVDSSGCFYYSGDAKIYDSNFIQVGQNVSTFSYYTCGQNASVWTYQNSSSGLDYDSFDILLQTSCDIYTDSSYSKVFTQPEGEALLCQTLTAQKIVELTIQTMVGLVPSVIGLLILVMGFWMAYRLLAKALRMA